MLGSFMCFAASSANFYFFLSHGKPENGAVALFGLLVGIWAAIFSKK